LENVSWRGKPPQKSRAPRIAFASFYVGAVIKAEPYHRFGVRWLDSAFIVISL
jgi:hypothetical protein